MAKKTKKSAKKFSIMDNDDYLLKNHPVEQITHELLLNSIVEMNLKFEYKEHDKAKHVAGISGLILTLIFAVIISEDFMMRPFQFRLGMLVILAGSLFSILIAIQATEVKLHKPTKKLNLFFLGDDFSKVSFKDYVGHLKGLVTQQKDLIEEYAMVIHEIQHSIAIKAKMTKHSVWCLVGSLIIGGTIAAVFFF